MIPLRARTSPIKFASRAGVKAGKASSQPFGSLLLTVSGISQFLPYLSSTLPLWFPAAVYHASGLIKHRIYDSTIVSQVTTGNLLVPVLPEAEVCHLTEVTEAC